MKIYLLRHGETAFNAQRRYLGRTDAPLSPEGRAALRPAGFPAEKVYVSDLLRTAQTAKILFPNAQQISIPALREMDFGIFEGYNYEELSHSPAYREWVDGGCLEIIPGGEGKDAFCARVCAAFTALADAAVEAGEDQLVIVAHGGTQMAALERYVLPRKGYFDWKGPYGGGFVLDAGRWQAERVLTLVERVEYTR